MLREIRDELSSDTRGSRSLRFPYHITVHALRVAHQNIIVRPPEASNGELFAAGG